MPPNAPARATAHRHAGRAAPSLTGAALRAALAAALVIDGVVHVRDAYFYDANTGTLLSQGQLFRIQGAVAFLVAAALVLLPAGRGRWRVLWVVAFAVAASAFGAVLLYSYVNVGPLAGLPNMYEPSWGPPGKAISAGAEGAGALLALAGLAWAVHRGRDARRPA